MQLAKKAYTAKQIDDLIKRKQLFSNVCQNEVDGEFCLGFDTIQISINDDCDYIGEFVGERNSDEYQFNFYI